MLSKVTSPLIITTWERALAPHPDRAFAQYITEGLRQGFRVGFRHSAPLRSATSNMESARQHRGIIGEYLGKELSLGRMLGPFPKGAQGLPQLHINRFGIIPKGHNTGKWRLITDLSFPPSFSVNDGIDKDMVSLSYTTVDEVAARQGEGALLAMIDIESAYRLIPVHPDDRPLQAMRWQGRVYVDPMLPFGLRSAPKVFNAVADALCWYLHQEGIPIVRHYLDDYIIVAPPAAPQCQENLDTLDRVCRELGVSTAAHKRDCPTTCLSF